MAALARPIVTVLASFGAKQQVVNGARVQPSPGALTDNTHNGSLSCFTVYSMVPSSFSSFLFTAALEVAEKVPDCATLDEEADPQKGEVTDPKGNDLASLCTKAASGGLPSCPTFFQG